MFDVANPLKGIPEQDWDTPFELYRGVTLTPRQAAEHYETYHCPACLGFLQDVTRRSA